MSEAGGFRSDGDLPGGGDALDMSEMPEAIGGRMHTCAVGRATAGGRA